jgi:hypothetical protein
LEISNFKEITKEGKKKLIGGNLGASCFRAVHHSEEGTQ